MTQMRKELAVTEETTLLPFLLREVTGKSPEYGEGTAHPAAGHGGRGGDHPVRRPLRPGQRVTPLPPGGRRAAELPFGALPGTGI